MQLRTFLAKDMKEALATVRADMGPEAVIIASEKAKSGGVLVRAALDSVDEETPVAEDAPVATPVADFETHYRDGLLRRLRASDAGKSRLSFDRNALIAALNRHRLPEGLAHALAETATKAQLTDMTLALASALDKKLRVHPIDVEAAGDFADGEFARGEHLDDAAASRVGKSGESGHKAILQFVLI